MKTLHWLKHALDYLGGTADAPPAGLKPLQASLWWGVWWGLLAVTILFFSGQTSKFIYIDF